MPKLLKSFSYSLLFQRSRQNNLNFIRNRPCLHLQRFAAVTDKDRAFFVDLAETDVVDGKGVDAVSSSKLAAARKSLRSYTSFYGKCKLPCKGMLFVFWWLNFK